MVSLKDIANRCGVSVATVSKALNDLSDISGVTKQRILKTADELGYQANSAARALKTNKTYNLGVLYVDEGSRGLTHEFFAAVLNSFKAAAEDSGYDITFIHNKNIGNRKSTYLQHCKYRGVDGLLIACADFSDPQILELTSSDLPIVTLDYVFENKSAVLSDNADGIISLVRYAYSMGHRKIAYISGESDVAVTGERKKGFYSSVNELGLELPDEYLVSSYYYQPEECYREMKRLLALENRPTCVLCPDDFAMMGGIRAVRELGLQIPDDISLIGYDGIVLSEAVSPKSTTYRQDTSALGTAAARKLIELIENPENSCSSVTVIRGSLKQGESVGRIKPFV